MKILLLGATGRTGKLVLEKALESGYEVNCLSRKTERIEKLKDLTLFEGDPENRADIGQAMIGCNGIISVLNISRTSDFPWARLRTRENYLSEVMKAVVPIAEEQNVRRISLCSAWGVAETANDVPGWFRWFVENSNIGVAYKDHERQEKILMDSKLDWTIVRPVGLINSPKEQNVRESYNNVPKPRLTISRESVARFLVESLSRKELIEHKIVISKE